MANWPTLSRVPALDGFEDIAVHDPTIRSRTMDGRPLTRPGPGSVRRGWRFVLRAMNSSDKAALDTFQDVTVQVGGEPFTWTDPRPGGTSHTVRMAQPLSWSQEEDGSYRTPVELHEE